MIALAFVCVASWAPGARPGARWCPPVSRPALPSATARFGRVLALGDGEHANAVEPVDSSVAQQPVAAGAMTTQQALTQTAIAVLAAVAFGIGVAATRGYADASAWFTAYVLEESLSIDNLFVFSLIFDYFKTPASAQPRVLKWGLIVAVVLRAAFITGGLAAVERFKGVLLLFAGVLIYSACGLLFEEKGEDEDLSQNAVILFAKEYLPWPTSDAYDGDSFFTTSADGLQRLATPLLLALVCVELSDVLFAVDSIPAVFGVTTSPFIAFTSNAFALFGLRALYTLIANAVGQFQYLQTAIALVLGFIGAKLVLSFGGYEIPTEASLLIVLGTLSGGVGASIVQRAAATKEVGAAAELNDDGVDES